jgi:hypothetical protein
MKTLMVAGCFLVAAVDLATAADVEWTLWYKQSFLGWTRPLLTTRTRQECVANLDKRQLQYGPNSTVRIDATTLMTAAYTSLDDPMDRPIVLRCIPGVPERDR